MRYTVKKGGSGTWLVYFDDEWVDTFISKTTATRLVGILNDNLDTALNAQPKVCETELTREQIALAVLTKLVTPLNDFDSFFENEKAIDYAFKFADAFIAYRDKN